MHLLRLKNFIEPLSDCCYRKEFNAFVGDESKIIFIKLKIADTVLF
jgi:hypothetical protein